MKNYSRKQAVKASFLGIFVLFILSLVLLNNLSATVKRSGSVSNGYGRGITVDYEGNSYVTGYFWGEAHFGENILTGYEGTRTIFIAKLNSEGEWLWVRKAGGNYWDEGRWIALDSEGNCYVTGWFNGEAEFGEYSLQSGGFEDIFVAKLDEDGNWLWAKKAGGSGDNRGVAIDVDSEGNAFVTGWFTDLAHFDEHSVQSRGELDAFVAKIDKNGYWQWVYGTGNRELDTGIGVATDIDGNCYVTGRFRQIIGFGSIIIESNGECDIFVAKSDPNGNWLWAKAIGGIREDVGRGISVDGKGNVYISGWVSGNVTVDDTELNGFGDFDVFVAKLDSEGNLLWGVNAGGELLDVSVSIETDERGFSYITGNFNEKANFGEHQLYGSNSENIYVAKLDSEGEWLWASSAGGKLNDSGISIAIDKQGNSYVTGYVSSDATFGEIVSGASNPVFIGTDIFIAKLNSEGEWLWVNRINNFPIVPESD